MAAIRGAEQREATAASVLAEVAKDVAAGRTVIVAVDMNTPLDEPCKTGSDLLDDASVTVRCSDRITPATCGSQDGYDDTHALFISGIVSGMKMRRLTSVATGRTFASPEFLDQPIDHIYVAGPGADRFGEGKRIGTAAEVQADNATRWLVFGSDHYPLLAVYRD
jgi:endonuclease/exonuclease/phosphatase family metal-dependent hydrolase